MTEQEKKMWQEDLDMISKLNKEVDELHNKIDKAIEYIETNVKEHMHDDYDITMYYALNQNECDELLKILKGKENN